MKKQVLFFAFALFAQAGYSQIISTIAGNGTSGFSGDGGQATAAQFQYPAALAIDASGNVYVSDHYDHRIRKVTPAGIISTVAGNGTPGNSGDGAAATAAQLKNPTNIKVDGSGNLYIVDHVNFSIRKVTASGIISTIAGIGTMGFSGDGGPATAAQLNGAFGIAFDGSGNMYISDAENMRIRKVSTSGIITTYAGNGSSGYTGDGGQATAAEIGLAYGLAVDASDNLYIADNINNCIRKVAPSGIISTLAGTGTAGYSGDGGAATAAQLNGPYNIAIDASGAFYVTDLGNRRIRKISSTGTISTIAGTGASGYSGDGGSPLYAQLSNPVDVALDGSNNIYIGDAGNKRVRKISPGSTFTSVLGSEIKPLLITFPNPNRGVFTINISNAVAETTLVTITNSLGQKIKEISLSTNKDTELKLNAPAGVYFLTAIINGKPVSEKIVLE